MGLISLIVGGIVDANKAIKQNKAKNDDSLVTVPVKGLYSIDVPGFLSPTTKLNDDASLQYMSKTLDIAFVVIDEPKAEFQASLDEIRAVNPGVFEGESLIANMATVVLNNLFDMEQTEICEYRETTINGLPALIVDAFQKRTFFKDALYASCAFIEGHDTVYQVLIQSGGTSIKKLAEKINRSIYSFRELVSGPASAPVQAPASAQRHEQAYMPSETSYQASAQPAPAPEVKNPEPPAAYAPEYKFCHSCGTKLPANARFCASCGSPQNVK